jgi:hypothetical protein
MLDPIFVMSGWLATLFGIGFIFFFVPTYMWGHWLQGEFIYRDYFNGALRTLALSTTVAVLVVLPLWRYGWEDAFLAIVLFFYLTTLSFGWFTYDRHKTLGDNRLGLVIRDDSEYGFGAPTTINKDLKIDRIAVCHDCLSLVSLKEKKCWNCKGNFEWRRANRFNRRARRAERIIITFKKGKASIGQETEEAIREERRALGYDW